MSTRFLPTFPVFIVLSYVTRPDDSEGPGIATPDPTLRDDSRICAFPYTHIAGIQEKRERRKMKNDTFKVYVLLYGFLFFIITLRGYMRNGSKLSDSQSK